MAITDAVVARPDIDGDRTAMMGGSFGGYMANWIAGHTGRFTRDRQPRRAVGADQMLGTTDAPAYWWRTFGDPLARPERYQDQLAAPARGRHPDTPMLVIHGDKDYRVPVGEALRLWTDLSRHGKTARFLYFPDENHWILKPGDVPGLVRDGLRVPGRARPRREVAAPATAVGCPVTSSTAGCQAGGMTRAQLDREPGEVSAMFDKVADRYDLLNDALSLGQDRYWRSMVARAVGARPGERGARPGGRHRHLVAHLHHGRRPVRGLRLLARHAAGRGRRRPPPAVRLRRPATRWPCRSPTRPSTP